MWGAHKFSQRLICKVKDETFEKDAGLWHCQRPGRDKDVGS